MKRICATILLVSLLRTAAADGGTAAWSVSGERIPCIEVVLPASAPTEFAASELARYLEAMLGKPISVASARPGQPAIVLETRADTNLGDEGYEMAVEGNRLCLRGGGDLGVVYAAYEFLRRCGCRFSGLGPDGEHVPRRDTLAVEGLPVRMKPKLWYRGLQLSIYEGAHRSEAENTDLAVRWIDWMAKNGFNYVMFTPSRLPDGWFDRHIRPEMLKRGLKFDMGHHNLDFWLSPKQHFAEHPEWFPMAEGKRVASPNQLAICSSSPAAVQSVIANVKCYLRAHPEVSIVGVIPGDGYGLCHCADCTKLDVANGIDAQEQFRRRTTGRGNLAKTRRYTLLVNEVARAVRAEFPRARVGSAAYVDLTWPDKQMPMESNVVTWVATYWADGSRPLAADSTSEINRMFFDALKQWRQSHPGRVITYSYYMGMNAQASLPYPQDRVILREWQNLKALGIEGATMQNWPGNHEVYALNLLAFARSAWQEVVDADALLADYLEGMYGAAAGEVRPIFNSFHEAWQRAEEAGTVILPNRRSIGLLLESLGESRLDDCLRRAREKAATDRERRQIERLAKAATYWKMAAEVCRLEQRAETIKTKDKPAAANLRQQAVSKCDEVLAYLPQLPPGWAAVTVPRVWTGVREKLAGKGP